MRVFSEPLKQLVVPVKVLAITEFLKMLNTNIASCKVWIMKSILLRQNVIARRRIFHGN